MEVRSSEAMNDERVAPDLAFGELISPSVIRPVQFQDMWSRSLARTCEQRLALAVLQQAVTDLLRFRQARRPRFQRLYLEAYQWVAQDDEIWPFSFVNICQTLDLCAFALRAELLTVGASPRLPQAA